MDVVNLLTDVAGLGLLALIFLRLGAIGAAVGGIETRVLSLENWRDALNLKTS
ncbi:MAG: hypothetical protein MI806_34215 [Minwuiales bacterium]|nr:hypothetical protein [Minwuiales bacterium]